MISDGLGQPMKFYLHEVLVYRVACPVLELFLLLGIEF